MSSSSYIKILLHGIVNFRYTLSQLGTIFILFFYFFDDIIVLSVLCVVVLRIDCNKVKYSGDHASYTWRLFYDFSNIWYL